MKSINPPKETTDEFLETAFREICSASEAFEKWRADSEQFSSSDEARAFAFFWAMREARETGVDMKRVFNDPVSIRFLYRRILAWRAARLMWHAYDMRTKCPDVCHPDKGVAEGAFVGWLYSDPMSKKDGRLSGFVVQHKPRAAKKAFLKWAGKPNKQTSRHPELDSWLILIWPVITEYLWTYRDVYEAAIRRFPETTEHPLGLGDDLAKHCRKLGLRVTNTAGKKKKPATYTEAVRPPLFNFVMDIRI